MARVRIELPERFLFSTELTVRASDLNYWGHVGHDNILSLMQEARILFLKDPGFEIADQPADAVSQIIADVAVVYVSESFFGDQLVIAIAAGEITAHGFELFYKITNKASDKEVARGKTGIVCFDYQTRKITSVPTSLLMKLKPN